MSGAAGDGTDRRAVTRRSAASDDVDEPVLPTRSSEDTEQAWGDGDGRRDDEWYRRERPPHHE